RTLCTLSVRLRAPTKQMALIGALELGDARAGAVLVLLARAAAHAARALGHALPDDRHAALARDHVAPLRRGNALDNGTARALGELAARPGEGDGGDGLALAAVHAGPDGAVHPAEDDQTAARVAHRDADPDVHFLGFVECALHDLVRLSERQRHVGSSGARGG